ncbi:ArdC family protein [Vibrio furnissii]|nr:zincin-like metallopeptidase domain-containing protein [Vibrio furnissii]MBY7933102.1 DUF1738 domain-containing protein [Vibrio fluvialis]MCG6230240.1 zincin-like metallopeptidase domain-containing protein [Vibrio furnissii]MCG6268506.1 zincin-like metallopeptidase domain-containing protein [Vibrio furnissii]
MAKATKSDFYETVTNSIISALEAGVKPWSCPWETNIEAGISGLPYNLKSQNTYNGINVLLLWASATENRFSSPAWLSYKQAQEMGGQVRKGEKSTQIVFYKQVKKEDEQGKEEIIPIMKTYAIFNLDQIDGIESPVIVEPKPIDTNDYSQYSHVEQVITDTGANIIVKGIKAFYRPSADFIVMPEKHLFKSAADYFATKLHELSHWTGAKHRLDRKGGNSFGDEAYAFEELVAELSSAFLCADLSVVGEVQHASYIANWLRALKNDKRYIFKAAAQAAKAHHFIMNPVTDDVEHKHAA